MTEIPTNSETAAAIPAPKSPRDVLIQKWKPRFALIACLLLATLFATLSYTAVVGKSATFDENLHVVGGFMHRFFHDYRINPEDPPLFGWWSALPHGAITLMVDTTSSAYQLVPKEIAHQWTFVFDTLYRTKDNDAQAVVNASRWQFVMVGIVLFGVIVGWAWRLRGWAAAIVAGTLFALDPNFLAHSAMVKNDVPMSLLLLVFAAAVWRMGRHITPINLLLVGLACGAAINVKFSGVLLGPMLILLLILRAALPGEWRAFGFPLRSIGMKLLVVPIITLLVIAMIWTVTWASYGFRFGALQDGGTLETDGLIFQSRFKAAMADNFRHGITTRNPTREEFEAHPTELAPQAILWMESRHILPQAWLYGFLYTYATTKIRSTFLMGETRIIGWWYYFPLAMLFKTPVTTLLVAFVAAIGAAIRVISPKLREWLHDPDREVAEVDLWTAFCLGLPPMTYLLAAMSSNLNLGLRHVLPVYPFIFVAVGLFAARIRSMFPRGSLVAGGVLLLALASESLPIWPNYLAYFNFPSGGAKGGIHLLADSNLDWGQDLPLLAQWQKSNHDRPLYLSYFGIADPAYYGIVSRSLEGAPPFYPQNSPQGVTEPCYIAVSATNLQGVYLNNKPFDFLKPLTPVAVLGGTIYVYRWN